MLALIINSAAPYAAIAQREILRPLREPMVTVTLQKKIGQLHYITTFFCRVTLHYTKKLANYITLQLFFGQLHYITQSSC